MIDRYLFDEGFSTLKNPLDGWSYISSCAWRQDFCLLSKLFAADNEALTQILSCNNNVKTYELFLAFEKKPVLGNIIISHYNLPGDHFLFLDFLRFLLYNVEIAMDDIADCVFLKPDQVPFDLLPFQSLMNDYVHISRHEFRFCKMLKPVGLDIYKN